MGCKDVEALQWKNNLFRKEVNGVRKKEEDIWAMVEYGKGVILLKEEKMQEIWTEYFE